MRGFIFSMMAVILLAIATSCSDGEAEQRAEIGQYVYVDGWCVIHVDKDCAAKSNENRRTKDERIISSRGVVFTDTCSLTWYVENVFGTETRSRFCPRCVDDEAYNHLRSIMRRNAADGS